MSDSNVAPWPPPAIVAVGKTALVHAPANVRVLSQAVRSHVADAPDMLQNLGQGARQAYDALYNEDANYQTLMQIYEQAIAQSAKTKS
jgi:hypothetical protein